MYVQWKRKEGVRILAEGYWGVVNVFFLDSETDLKHLLCFVCLSGTEG